MGGTRRLAWGLALWLAGGAVAPAHEFWIDPPAPGAAGATDLRVGQDMAGNALPWLDKTVARALQADAGGLRPLSGRDGDLPALALDLTRPGLHIVAVETHPAYAVFDDLAEFAEYLAYEGLAPVAEAHVARGLPLTDIAEAYLRNARMLVQVGPDDGTQADRPLGLPFELVVEGSPFRAGASGLALRLTWQGDPASGTQVALFHRDTAGRVTRRLFTTDTGGRIRLPAPLPGDHLFNAVRIDPVEGPGDVRWRSHWASLTFHLGE